MYEMYSWNAPEETENEAVEAVQLSLDRRDNGGRPSE